MDTAHKRVLLGFVAGIFMALVVWLNVSEASPVYALLMENPAVGHGLLILNLPALFVSRVISGTPPSAMLVYLACFVQWFALGVWLSFAVWPGAAQPGAVRQ